jgi:hypothetical protein
MGELARIGAAKEVKAACSTGPVIQGICQQPKLNFERKEEMVVIFHHRAVVWLISGD